MPEQESPRALVQLTRDECLELLRQSRVGRIGLSMDALPVVLPVNFLVDGDDLVIRTVPGTKLEAATAKAIVAFEVDGYSSDGRSGWSVMAQGEAGLVADPAEVERLRSLPLESWALDGAADRYVRISIAVVTGRRFTVR